MNTYIVIGILVLSGLAVFFTWNSNRNLNKTDIAENEFSSLNNEHKQDYRTLRLVVSYGFEGETKTISEKATEKMIKTTMESINWEQFHIVYLEDAKGNMMDVGGSLIEDGLSSGYVNDDVHLLKVNPPETVEEMTEILLDFLNGENIWRNKYEYN